MYFLEWMRISYVCSEEGSNLSNVDNTLFYCLSKTLSVRDKLSIFLSTEILANTLPLLNEQNESMTQ